MSGTVAPSLQRRQASQSADPTPLSPSAASEHAAYETVRDASQSSYPASIECVVRHILSGTYWRCAYAIRDDDSDYECPAKWVQVTPVQKTITVYERVGS